MRCVLAVLMLVSLSAPATAAAAEESGYLEARDGTRLRYHVIRPDGPGPFPVVINYEGYAAGSNASDNGVSTYTNRLLQRGYALMGVSVRGTGCSQGTFDPFDLTMGTDGYDAVEWAADQPWSDGRVGMIGVSFGGITQLLTAATRPPHLRAIAPSSSLSDLYRDVAYPGGSLEYDFPFAWTAIQKEGGTQYALTGGDAECTANFLDHETRNARRENLIPALILDNPFTDSRDGLWDARSPLAGFDDIDVPTYLLNAWQDEQLPGRIYGNLKAFARPDRVWANFSNGNHGRDYASPTAQQLTLDFLDRFVRDVDNGWDEKVPHLSLWMETALRRNGKENEPAWAIERDSLVIKPKPRTLYLRADGALSKDKPKGDEPGDDYGYPLPSSDVLEPGPMASLGPLGIHTTGHYAWKTPVPPGGQAAYTGATLDEDLVVAGPASLDVWMASTGSDFDLQATLTEVRPDGQETYVQRGWLRASQRKLDTKASSDLRPVQTHRSTDVQPLEPGEPALMRLEVFPFAHAFRKGSRLRLWIEAPTGHTGFWAFAPRGGPAINTVLHDKAHPSRLVLGVLPGEQAGAPLPACDTLRNQPCRPDPLASGAAVPGRAATTRCAGGRVQVALRPGMRGAVVRLGARRVSRSVRVVRPGVLTVVARDRSGRRVVDVRRLGRC